MIIFTNFIPIVGQVVGAFSGWIAAFLAFGFLCAAPKLIWAVIDDV